jgi:hypothetical protein
MKNSPYLDRPLLPLAVALPDARTDRSQPCHRWSRRTRRLRQRADLIRELLTPEPTEPRST